MFYDEKRREFEFSMKEENFYFFECFNDCFNVNLQLVYQCLVKIVIIGYIFVCSFENYLFYLGVFFVNIFYCYCLLQLFFLKYLFFCEVVIFLFLCFLWFVQYQLFCFVFWIVVFVVQYQCQQFLFLFYNLKMNFC